MRITNIRIRGLKIFKMKFSVFREVLFLKQPDIETNDR